jgi:hypothetical protein
MAQGDGFLRDMGASRGYLALAAPIFGKWWPWPVLSARLLFATADAAQARLQGGDAARHRRGAGTVDPDDPLSDHARDPDGFCPHGATAARLAALFAGSIGPRSPKCETH